MNTKNKESITVSEAADEFDVSPETLRIWIDRGLIEATRKSDAPKSPYLIKKTSLQGHLYEKGKLDLNKYPMGASTGENTAEEEIERNSANTSRASNNSDGHQHPGESPSPHPEVKNQHEWGTIEHPEEGPFRHSRKKGRRFDKAKPKKQRVYPCKLTLQQVKDTIRSMSLDESVHLRNWLTNRIDNKVRGQSSR